LQNVVNKFSEKLNILAVVGRTVGWVLWSYVFDLQYNGSLDVESINVTK